MAQWMSQRRSAADAMARVRVEEVGSVDLRREAEALEPFSRVAMRERAKSTTSGLVIQQRLFHRRPRGT
jgi:hypothetical protein